MKILNHDSPLHRSMSLVADVVLIGIIWTLTSIPLITIGASTTAAYYVFTKKASGRDSYLIKDYFKSFFGNFIKSTIMLIILAIIFTLLILNVNFVQSDSIFGWITLIFNYFLILQATFVLIYIFPLLSRFESRFFAYFKQAAFMANRHLLTTLANMLLIGFLVVLSIYFSFLILFVMGIYCYLSSVLIVKIFKKHRPDFDVPISEAEKNDTRIVFDDTPS